MSESISQIGVTHDIVKVLHSLLICVWCSTHASVMRFLNGYDWHLASYATITITTLRIQSVSNSHSKTRSRLPSLCSILCFTTARISQEQAGNVSFMLAS